MKEFQGQLDARSKRFAIVAARFNETIVEALVRGAVSALERLGAEPADISIYRVPGAFEIPPLVARLIASTKDSAAPTFDAIICLGAVIRGATPHFDYVAGESARGLQQLAVECPVPILNGILTTDSIEQALERAGTKAGNKGQEAAFGAVEMLRLYEQI